MLKSIRALLCLLLVSCFCWGQDAQTPAFKARTDVVLVPVVVRNQQAFVNGLKPEQFSVTEDGKPQKVASIELIQTGGKVLRRSRPGEFSNELTASGPARLLVICIDTINTPFLDQAFARQQLLKYIASSLETGDQVAVFGMYRDGSVRMLHDITGDQAMLAEALTSQTPMSARARDISMGTIRGTKTFALARLVLRSDPACLSVPWNSPPASWGLRRKQTKIRLSMRSICLPKR